VDIFCGTYSSFAIVGRRGHLMAWGLNNCGQLGLPLAPAGECDGAG
jgi:alpha-tubulin suppressor-like RCC1 family protein